MDTLSDSRRSQRAADFVTSARSAVRSVPRQAVNYGTLRIVTTTTDLGDDVARQVLDEAPTAVQRYRTVRGLQQIDSTTVRRLSDSERVDLGQFLVHHGRAGGQFVDEGGLHARRLVLDSDLDGQTTSQLVQAYREDVIDVDDLRRISNGLAEDVNDLGVRQALRRASELEADGHDVLRMRSAEKVNNEDHAGSEPPYASETMVIEYETDVPDEFVRAHRADNQARSWMIREHTIGGLNPSEVQDKLSLPREPVYASDVEVPAGTRVQTGTIEANLGGQRGATQFELIDDLDSDRFNNRRRLSA